MTGTKVEMKSNIDNEWEGLRHTLPGAGRRLVFITIGKVGRSQNLAIEIPASSAAYNSIIKGTDSSM